MKIEDADGSFKRSLLLIFLRRVKSFLVEFLEILMIA
jgi:hypothetical protein